MMAHLRATEQAALTSQAAECPPGPRIPPGPWAPPGPWTPSLSSPPSLPPCPAPHQLQRVLELLQQVRQEAALGALGARYVPAANTTQHSKREKQRRVLKYMAYVANKLPYKLRIRVIRTSDMYGFNMMDSNSDSHLKVVRVTN